MTEPARVARLWVALAVATLWVISVGSAQKATTTTGDDASVVPELPGDGEVRLDEPALQAPDLPDLSVLVHVPTPPRQRRSLRLFRLGWIVLL